MAGLEYSVTSIGLTAFGRNAPLNTILISGGRLSSIEGAAPRDRSARTGESEGASRQQSPGSSLRTPHLIR